VHPFPRRYISKLIFILFNFTLSLSSYQQVINGFKADIPGENNRVQLLKIRSLDSVIKGFRISLAD